MMTDVFASPLHTISKINGHAPAGGTVLSLSTDYRIALNGPYKVSRAGSVAAPFPLISF